MHSLPADPSPADALLRAWADAFNASDLDAIVALYADDALLWGTTAQAVIGSPDGIAAYFAAVFALRPTPMVEVTSALARCHAECAVIAGSYTLELPAAGVPARWPARYSLTVRRDQGRWRIAAHHSSLLSSGAVFGGPADPAAC